MGDLTLTENEQAEVKAMVQYAVYAYRDLMASELGQQAFGGDRDYYRILGYKQSLTLLDYHTRYERGDIASRIVDLPAQDTWRRPPQVTEGGDTTTPFARAWDALVKRLKVWSKLSRLDKLAGLGRYGVLLLGVAGGRLEDPLTEKDGPESLRYLRPFAELHAEIEEVDTDPNSPRYNMPVMYRLTFQDKDGGETPVMAHHTRILHIADNKLDSDIFGIPRLKQVWNRLDDLVKLTGGSAEATWLNMRRGTVFQTREGYKLSGDESDIDQRQDMIRRYVHDMARILVLEGLEVGDLGSSTVDPRGVYEVTLAQISASTGIPQRVLVGSAQGELAAAEQDTKIWYDKVASRQKTWAEPDVLRPFIDRLIEFGMLPSPAQGYDVGEEDERGEHHWPSLWQVSEVEAAAISMNRGQAVAAVRDPVTGTVPVTDGELRNILGLPFVPPERLEEPEPPERTPPPPPQRDDEQQAVPTPGPTPSANLATALENYEQGKITARDLARFAGWSWAQVEREKRTR